MKPDEIIHSLTLLIRLIDCSSGRQIREDNVILYAESGQELKICMREGLILLLNQSRQDTNYTIHVSGYEEGMVPVCYKKLNPELPIQTVYLIPKITGKNRYAYLCLEGKMPHMEYLEGIHLSYTINQLKQYDSETGIFTVFNPNKRFFNQDKYALINTKKQDYHKITMKEVLTPTTFTVWDPPDISFESGMIIAPVMFGRVDSEGQYAFYSKIDSKEQKYLMHFGCKGKQTFLQYDFQENKPFLL